MELFRSIIDHKKVFVLALNGPGVGGGAAWFTGLADIVLAAANSYLPVPFSSLGLVPEYGAAKTFAQSMGVRRANDFLMFGRKCSVEELECWGLINRTLPSHGFDKAVLDFLQEQLELNEGGSMLETKRLQNAPLRGERIVAMFDAASALAERFVEGVPMERFKRKNEELAKGEFYFYFFMAVLMMYPSEGVKAQGKRVSLTSRLSGMVSVADIMAYIMPVALSELGIQNRQQRITAEGIRGRCRYRHCRLLSGKSDPW